MAEKIISLSEADRKALRALLDRERHQVLNPRNRPAVVEADPVAPETYVARTPVGGIPGLIDGVIGTGTELGTGTCGSDRPGSADCQVWRVLDSDCGPDLSYAGFTQTVYNLAFDPVPGSTWALVTRDKYGTWFVTATASGSVGGPTFVRVTSYVLDLIYHYYPGVQCTYAAMKLVGSVYVPSFADISDCWVIDANSSKLDTADWFLAKEVDVAVDGKTVYMPETDRAFWAQLTARSGSTYSFRELKPTASGAGTIGPGDIFAVHDNARTGTFTAREVSGNTSVPVGTGDTAAIVALIPGYGVWQGPTSAGYGDRQDYRFSAPLGNDCDSITFVKEVPHCESGKLNIYGVTITLDVVGGCLTKTESSESYLRNEGSCGHSGYDNTGTGTGGTDVIIINYQFISNFTTYVSNVWYFNTYDNHLYININSVWYSFNSVTNTVTINYVDIQTFYNYQANTFYYNQYDNGIWININGIWIMLCPCYVQTGTGTGTCTTDLDCSHCTGAADATPGYWTLNHSTFLQNHAVFNGYWKLKRLSNCSWAQTRSNGSRAQIDVTATQITLTFTATIDGSLVTVSYRNSDFAGDCCTPWSLLILSGTGLDPLEIIASNCCETTGLLIPTECCPDDTLPATLYFDLSIPDCAFTGSHPITYMISLPGGYAGYAGWYGEVPCSAGEEILFVWFFCKPETDQWHLVAVCSIAGFPQLPGVIIVDQVVAPTCNPFYLEVNGTIGGGSGNCSCCPGEDKEFSIVITE